MLDDSGNERKGIEVNDAKLGLMMPNHAHCLMVSYDEKFDDEHKLNDEWWLTIRDLMLAGF